jgi:hypothetical protein
MTIESLVEGFDDFDEPETTEEALLKVEAQEGVEKIYAREIADKDELHSNLWGSFCFDLILNQSDHERVCAAFGLTLAGLGKLLDNTAFVDRLKDAKLQVKTLGPTAGFVLAARAQAEKHLVTLGNVAGDTAVPHVVRVKAIENLVRYAHLDPQTQKQARDNERQTSSPGVLVQFNIGGNLLGQNRRTLEVQTSNVIEAGGDL